MLYSLRWKITLNRTKGDLNFLEEKITKLRQNNGQHRRSSN